MNTANTMLTKRFIVGFLLILSCFTFFIEDSQGRDGTIDIYFKEMSLRDVFNTLAQLAGKNIIIHHGVEGTISLELKDVTFLKALDLITKVNELAYYQEDDTFIIGPKELIGTVFYVQKQKIIFLKNISTGKGQEILAPLFPDLKIQVDVSSNQMILLGSDSDLQKAMEILSLIDVEVPEEKDLFILPVLHTDPHYIVKSLKDFFPHVDIQLDEVTKSLIIKSTSLDFMKIERLIQGLDRPLEEVVEEVVEEEEIEIMIVSINHASTEKLRNLTQNLFEGMVVEIYEERESLILMGAVTQLTRALDFIRLIDQQKRQVLIEVQIEEISLTAQKELGIPDLSDLTLFQFSDGSFEVEFPSMLRLLQTRGASETLARPRLTTIDGEEARLIIGDEIPYEIRQVEDGVWFTEIIYIDAGIILEFLPRISDDNTITLRVSTEISSFFDVGRALPQIATRRAETVVRVQDGESIVIGGLIRDEEEDIMNKLPFLGELPLLGRLFQRRVGDSEKREIIIILTPRIIERTDLKDDLQQEVKAELLVENEE